jgi:hypothetical protein
VRGLARTCPGSGINVHADRPIQVTERSAVAAFIRGLFKYAP